MDKNLELMKKIIEEKKLKSANQKNNRKAQKTIGAPRKGRSSKKSGGVFDK